MGKITAFLEDHIEKIVLGLVGLLCLWLLVTRFLLSPNAVEYDRSTSGKPLVFSPGAIDKYIGEQARDLEDILDQDPEPLSPYESRLREYRARQASAITGVDFAIWPEVPQANRQGGGGGGIRKYNLPVIGGVDDAVANYIRAVVYAPTEEVTTERPYSQKRVQPKDLDLVTVQGSFDISGLYSRFEESFAGPGVKQEWRDPRHATPIFTAVQLQRQQANGDDVWSAWENIARTKIDHQREKFEIVEDVSLLPPGGLMVRMLSYSNKDVQADLLQPLAYQIASANEQWFPPLLHTEYEVLRASQAQAAKRKIQEEALEKKKSEEESSRRRRSSSPGGGILPGVSSYGVSGGSGGRDREPRRRPGSRTRGDTSAGSERRVRGRDEAEADEEYEYDDPTAPERAIEEVYSKLDEISIGATTDFRNMDTLIFWAHDDTAAPGQKYRYRLRLGVFNPVAGKNQLGRQDAARTNAVVLWSEFSLPTATVEIPPKMRFFAKDIQETAKTVTVQVSKYLLGNWYSEDFKIRCGQVIGDAVETKRVRKIMPMTRSMGSSYYSSFKVADAVTEPAVIDYDTGAILVDVAAVNDWSTGASMRSRRYFDMLYSYDGMNMDHMPVGDRYWPAELRATRTKISSSQRETMKALVPWGQRLRGEHGRRLDNLRDDERI